MVGYGYVYSGKLMSYHMFEHPIVRIYFSLKLVACGSLFLSGFLCEAGFYLYSAVYASDVLGKASTEPTSLVTRYPKQDKSSSLISIHVCIYHIIQQLLSRRKSSLNNGNFSPLINIS
jgi:hypothetical protein